MNLAVLTSSRADFGIYTSLLKKLRDDKTINLEIIAFGTHLSHSHGYTLTAILEQGLEVQHRIESLIIGDSEEAVSSSMGMTLLKFSSFWAANNKYDLVFCLGDRFEMFAAVMAGVPFNVKFAHIHGGETTLGAIDNVFRHAISHASQMHFTSTSAYADRLTAMLDDPSRVHNVGALSLDDINSLELYTAEEFRNKWAIDLGLPTILVTFHPETVHPSLNEQYAHELCEALESLVGKYQVVITMANADTNGYAIRDVFKSRLAEIESVHFIESFGKKGYFTIMSRCSFLIGNTSSGIIEAASFNKYVINVGDRQKGRLSGNNVFHTPVSATEIKKVVKAIESFGPWSGENIYSSGNAAEKITQIIKYGQIQ